MSGSTYFERRTSNDAANDADDSENTMDDDTPVGNETSSLYATIDPLYYGARRAIEASPSDTTSFSNRDESDMSPQERWYAAIYYARKAVGKRHSEAHEFSMDDYREAFGPDYPAVETGEVETTLGVMANHGIDVDDLRDKPVLSFKGVALPLIVESEGELEEALDALDSAVPEEPATAESADESADESDDADDEGGYFGGESSDKELEGYVTPGSLTVSNLRDRITSIHSLDTARAMLNDERDDKKRKTAMKALQSRVNKLRQSESEPESEPESEAPSEEPSDEGSEEGGSVPEGLTFNLPDDASRGTRLQKAGVLMDEFNVAESEAMNAVGL